MIVNTCTTPEDVCAICGELARDIGQCAIRIGPVFVFYLIPICNDISCRMASGNLIEPLTPPGAQPSPLIL
jgi:hypothetical protein